jgi:pyruvate kinase
VTAVIPAAAVVAYTSSGHSALRMARERPGAPIVGMTPRAAVARRLALAWGVYPVLCHEVADVMEMSEWACRTVQQEGMAHPGDTIVISAGIPFGTPGTTNLLRIMQIA